MLGIGTWPTITAKTQSFGTNYGIGLDFLEILTKWV